MAGCSSYKHVVESAIWFRKAAEQGHTTAQYQLGVKYTTGDGVERSSTEAFKWFRQAAERSQTMAQFKLGLCYANGEGVGLDLILAHAWWEIAAAKGDNNARFYLPILEKQMTSQQITTANITANKLRTALP